MNADTLRLIRKTHLYFGLFISPALLFFAFTGALQTFSLHETTRGRDYTPPQWAVVWSQIHKKQTWIVPPHKAPPAPKPPATSGVGSQAGPTPASPADSTSPASRERPAPDSGAARKTGDVPTPGPEARSHLPLKIFFLLVSIGLFTSTLTGVTMAYKYERGKLLVTALLLAGAVIPLLLLAVLMPLGRNLRAALLGKRMASLCLSSPRRASASGRLQNPWIPFCDPDVRAAAQPLYCPHAVRARL